MLDLGTVTRHYNDYDNDYYPEQAMGRWVMGQCPLTHDPCRYFRIHSQILLSQSEIKERIAY